MKGNSTSTFMLHVVCLVVLATSALSASNTCSSQDCRDLAHSIQENIEASADPCQDFFQYACGNFLKKNPVPADKAVQSTMVAYSARLKQKLYNLLEEPESPDDSSFAKAAKRQYKTCKDEGAMEAAGLTALLNVIHKNGGWPMIVPNEFPYKKRVLEVQDELNRITGNGPLYTVLVYSRTVHSSDNAITLDQPAAFPKRGYNVSDPVEAQKFVKYIAGVAAEFAKADGVVVPQERLNQDAQNVVDFMVELTELRDPDEWRLRGPSMNVSAAQAAIANGTNTSFNLLAALQRLYSDVPEVNVTNEEVINFRELNYMQELVKLLRKTSPVTVLNYMFFHFVEPYLSLTTNAVRKLVDEVYDFQPVNRTVQCSSLPYLQAALGRMYVKKYVPESKKRAAENLLKDLKEQIEVQINRSAFVDAETKPHALAKVRNLVSHVAYIDAYQNDDEVAKYYEKHQLTGNVVEDSLNYRKVEYTSDLAELRVPIVKNKTRENSYLDPILDVGWYAIRFNRLELPAGLLETPLFSENYPPLSNLAGFGQIPGILLTDLFSYLGTSFDDQGNVSAWASNATEMEFLNRDQCFVQQYSNSSIKELTDAGLFFNTSEVDYKPVLAQYHFALKTAYLVHRAKLNTNVGHHNLQLPLDASPDAQFFLNFANSFCQSVNPPKLLEALDNVPHIPTGRINVNSAVANLPEFSQTYKCALGTPMNPAKKCSLLD